MPLIAIAPNASIDEDDLQYAFARASGPGGQNVDVNVPQFDTIAAISTAYREYDRAISALGVLIAEGIDKLSTAIHNLIHRAYGERVVGPPRGIGVADK